MVRTRVEPPAPYVTETNPGRSGLSKSTVCNNCEYASSLRGGKNSNEKNGRVRARASLMRIARHLAETRDDASANQRPTVDHHKEQQLCRERDDGRAQHEHTEAHQDCGDG